MSTYNYFNEWSPQNMLIGLSCIADTQQIDLLGVVLLVPVLLCVMYRPVRIPKSVGAGVFLCDAVKIMEELCKFVDIQCLSFIP